MRVCSNFGVSEPYLKRSYTTRISPGIDIVYKRLPSISCTPSEVIGRNSLERTPNRSGCIDNLSDKVTRFLKTQAEDWKDFVREPVFMSSVAISALYLTVLSCVTVFRDLIIRVI